MARMGFVLHIQPGKVAQYVSAHESVWPEMTEAIRAAGIHNYTIFLDGNQAFGYLESDDFDRAWSYLAAQDVNARWQSAMAELLDRRVADEGPGALPEIFRLD